MAGEERGGVFAFIVLTIALSVVISLGIAVMILHMENTRLMNVDKEYREMKVDFVKTVNDNKDLKAENERLKSGGSEKQPEKE